MAGCTLRREDLATKVVEEVGLYTSEAIAMQQAERDAGERDALIDGWQQSPWGEAPPSEVGASEPYAATTRDGRFRYTLHREAPPPPPHE